MLQQNQLLSLLDKVLKQTSKVRKGHEAVYYCVFCNHYKKKLEINVDTQNWHCWICNARGKSIRSLFKKLQVNRQYYSELYKIIGKNDSGNYNKVSQFNKNTELSLPPEFHPLNLPLKSLEYGNALSYLMNRGVTKDDILRYNIGFCEYGEYNKRIIIPSYDANGNLNFFSSRTYCDNFFKYKNPPWSKNIIGFELLINWDVPVTLVEGAFDGISIRKNAIPLFGTIMPNKLKEAIIENGVWRVNIVLDNDALKKAIEIYDFIEKLKIQEIDVHVVQLKDKDPSVLGFDQINELINSSRPLNFSEMIRLKMNL